MIPQWVADEYEIRTIHDMEKHWELFEDPSDPGRGVFINCPTGNQCAEVNPMKMEAYKLYKTFNIANAASYGALEQALTSAQINKKPVFAYYWAPTTVMSQCDWYVLEEPAFNKGCWDQVIAASKDPSLRPLEVSCAYPDPGIHILGGASLEEKAPEVVALLGNMRVGLVALEETTAWFRQNSVQEREEAAVHYLNTYDDEWRNWMPKENFGKVFGALRELKREKAPN